MSKYTTEVRYICEESAGYSESQGLSKVDDILTNSWFDVVGTNWPCWGVVEDDGAAHTYHGELAKKILRHYYTREIGFETVALWKLKLNTKLNEIMPYYNDLYKTIVKKFDPFSDVDYTIVHDGGNNLHRYGENRRETDLHRDTTIGSSETTSVNTDFETKTNIKTDVDETNTHWDKYSDTPQGAVSHIDPVAPGESEYLTNARKITDNRNTHSEADDNEETTTHKGDAEDNYSETVRDSETGEWEHGNVFTDTPDLHDDVIDFWTNRYKGKMNTKSYMQLIKELRENLINIDMMIINDLSDLFMKIW